MKRYSLTFTFCETASEAFALVDELNNKASAYIRKHKPAHASVYGDEWIVFHWSK